MKKIILSIVALPFTLSNISYAAQVINLNHDASVFLQQYFANTHRLPVANQSASQVMELKRDTDVNQNTHIHVQQTYFGYPVWGGDAIIHMPSATKRSLHASRSATADGVFYQQLENDLQKQSPAILEQNNERARTQVLQFVKESYGMTSHVEDITVKPMIYVDKENTAHFAFYISLFLIDAEQKPVEPVYILDAQNFVVYENWNNIQSISVEAGGLGGNEKTPWIYDGTKEHLDKIPLDRDDATGICYLKNKNAMVYDFQEIGLYSKVKAALKLENAISRFNCAMPNEKYGNIYWSDSFDRVNGGYSPGSDALFAGEVIQNMYMNWYGLPMLVQRDPKDRTKKIPMLLKMVTHVTDPDKERASPKLSFNEYENAFFSNYYNAIFLGDGGKHSYPLTSVGLIAHEVSHGFTVQHANLIYTNLSGALNESFSDVAAQAAEQYAYGKMSGYIGKELTKGKNEFFRYLGQPSKDCHGRQPGNACSIDDMNQYKFLEETSYYYTKHIKNPMQREIERQSYIVHFASGVFNRAFFSMAVSPNWDARKVLAVLIQANRYYWTSRTDQQQAACGVMKATSDLKYETNVVTSSFDKVGIDTRLCESV